MATKSSAASLPIVRRAPARTERTIADLAQAASELSLGAFRSEALDRIDQAVGFDVALIAQVTNPTHAQPTLRHFNALAWRRFEEDWQRYLAEFGPTFSAYGCPLLRDAAIPDSLRLRLRFYTDVMLPAPSRAALHVQLGKKPETVILTLSRSGRRARFTDREVNTVSQLMPVLILGEHFQAAKLARAPKQSQNWDSLTPRERQIAVLVADGFTNVEIARELGTSPQTVRNQLVSVYRKIDVDRRDQLVSRAFLDGVARAART
jgi:DNA-binding CsgD family transcriptional regulator